MTPSKSLDGKGRTLWCDHLEGSGAVHRRPGWSGLTTLGSDLNIHRIPWCDRDMSPGLGTCPQRSARHPRWYDGARHGRVVTNAVRSPVRPATRWMRMVSRASPRVMAGRMVVSRRASIDVPAPGGPSKSRLWSKRLHQIHLCVHTQDESWPS